MRLRTKPRLRALRTTFAAPPILLPLVVLAAGLLVWGCSPGGTSTSTAPPAGVTGSSAGTSATLPPTTEGPGTSVSTTVVPPATIPPATGPPTTVSPPTTIFVVIGDYGMDDEHEAAVAALAASWEPAYIITTGDDYYTPAGGKGTARYDESTGAYYGPWLKDITTTGKRCPKGLAPVNAFFPSLGNHDYTDARPGPDTYLEYFDLPGEGFANSSGNERYYDFVEGPIHFFALNSNEEEPDGTSSTSKQAHWLKAQLKASTSVWNIVFDHHPPYSSDLVHSSSTYMQWPFAEWGADAVLSGHAHAYERLQQDGIVYFVNGLGGASRYFFGFAEEGSRVRYNADWGAQKVTVSSDALTFEFWNVSGRLIDSYTLPAKPVDPASSASPAYPRG